MLDNLLKNYPFGKLKDRQKIALEFLLKKLQGSIIQGLKQQSYVLATIKHETGDTFEPVVEGNYLKGNRVKKLFNYYLTNNPKAIRTIFPNGVNGINYLGRGFPQLTHLYNYETFGRLLSIDLVHNPDLALEPENAWKICELGMSRGLFTGKKLNDYFYDRESDWYRARQIINGFDRALEISEMAQKIYHVLEAK